MLTAYYNSQSVKTKTAHPGVKMQSHILEHENVPVHTWHTLCKHLWAWHKHGVNPLCCISEHINKVHMLHKEKSLSNGM
jgi:hypothetical protein